MNAARRDFLAFIGNGAVIGSVVHVASVSRPALLLPPRPPLIPPGAQVTACPLLDARPSQMEAILDIRAAIPGDAFRAWLEGGLQMGSPNRLLKTAR